MTFRERLKTARRDFGVELFALLAGAAADAIAPPPNTLISDWADQHRVVGEPSPWKGPWRTSRTPYLKQIMDVCSPSHPAREIDFIKATQIGATEAALNIIQFYSAAWPSHGMIVLPDKQVAGEWAENRFSQLFDSPELASLLIDQRHRKTGGKVKNAKLSKRLTNGAAWKFAWSSNGKLLSSTPAPILIADEVDRFEKRAGREGEPIELLRNRFSNFQQGKFFRLSSPVDEASSRIDRGFRDGDQRYFFAPCPLCNRFQRLIFANLVWPDGGWETRAARTAEAYYRCVKCNGKIEEWRKQQMFADARWVATATQPELIASGFDGDALSQMGGLFAAMDEALHPSFHLNALYTPVAWPDQRWQALAANWEAKKDNPETRKVFVMTKLAEVWAEAGETPDEARIYAKCEKFGPTVPRAVCFLTAFVDVQKDRLEYEVVGWDERQGRWSIDYDVIEGATDSPAVWLRLDELLHTLYPTEDGAQMPILVMGIDTGHQATTVYEFAKRHQGLHRQTTRKFGFTVRDIRTVVCTKGYSGAGKDGVIHSITADDGLIRNRGGVPLVWIDTIYAKTQIFDHVKHPKPAEGETTPYNYYHFPDTYSLRYFEQLCSERRVVEQNGKVRYEPIQGRRNEVLDIAVGNRAMAVLSSIENMTPAQMSVLRERLLADKPATAEPAAERREQPAAQPTGGSSWLGGGGRPGGGGGWFSR